ncbi:MAG: hypothetical protein OSJ54_02265 [Oscillospiraceae bacterium]|nr:hypothetical protein [Oscillospiraceae bacterium]
MIINKRSLKRTAAFLFSCCVCAALVSLPFANAASVSAMFSSSYRDTDSISVEIDVSAEHKAISPYIYGINAETSLSGLTVNALKQSDPRLSSYNWETNFSNSAEGKNGGNNNDLVKSYPADRQREPALYTDNLVSKAKRYEIPSRYVTLQMMGAAAADSAGAVYPSDGAVRWKRVLFRKNDSFFSEPDITDDAVYMDEYVSFLANKYGYAVDGGINGYFLDNEPENWFELYPYAVTRQITSDELIARSAELAGAVKRIDPTALVYGPSISGIEAFINLKNPDDWDKHAQDYSWFIDYYLKGMRDASEAAGTRLLDVLDIHYHTEATNGLLEPIISGTDNFSNNTRLQAPRILWDSTYTENSAIAIMHNQHIPLIPTLEASINMYYPGTKLSFSEYDFGGGGHISGGIAVADTLGIFAEYGVHMACLKPYSSETEYQKSGINIYTNFDGNGGKFGDTLVKSDNGGDIMSSVYASIDGGDETSLKVLLINKNQNSSKTAALEINSDAVFESAKVYSFGEDSPEIVLSDDEITVEDNRLSFDMEPLTVNMLVFKGEREVISIDEPDETTAAEVSDPPPEQDTPTEASVSEADTVTTVSVPEHVSAETHSTAGTSVVEVTSAPISESPESPDSLTDSEPKPHETDGETDGSGTSDMPDESRSVKEDKEDGSNEKEEKTVPKAVKTVIIILTSAVILTMVYVIVQDRVLSKKSQK